jgi:hypothetical protein
MLAHDHSPDFCNLNLFSTWFAQIWSICKKTKIWEQQITQEIMWDGAYFLSSSLGVPMNPPLYDFARIWFRPTIFSVVYDFAPIWFRPTIISALYDFAPILIRTQRRRKLLREAKQFPTERREFWSFRFCIHTHTHTYTLTHTPLHKTLLSTYMRRS